MTQSDNSEKQKESNAFFLEEVGYIPIILRMKTNLLIGVGQSNSKIDNVSVVACNLPKDFFNLSIDEISNIMDEKIDQILYDLLELLREDIEEQVAEQIALALAPIVDYSRANPEKEKPTETKPAGEQGSFYKVLKETFLPELHKQLNEDLFSAIMSKYNSFTKTTEHSKHAYDWPKVVTSSDDSEKYSGVIAGLPYEPFVYGEPETDSGINSVGHTHSGIWFPHSICGKYCDLFTSLEGKNLTEKLTFWNTATNNKPITIEELKEWKKQWS